MYDNKKSKDNSKNKRLMSLMIIVHSLTYFSYTILKEEI